METSRRIKQIETLSLELTEYPMDPLHSFIPTSPNTTLRRHNSNQSPESEKQEDCEEELNLGLSLGGQFGVDKSHKGLIRSSSVGGAITLIREEEALTRTASLPPETEEEWRRRKDFQSLRRMEAKRKRLEKQKCVKENRSSENLNLNLDPGAYSEPEKTIQGSGSSGEARSPESIQYPQPAGLCFGNRSAEVSRKHLNASDHQKKARLSGNEVENMPCVFTIGDGPKGRKVEGILYRYRKGEEVRIMCVCHGSFFSPAEFVNHAGARNVAYPLKRIVVNPNGSSFS